MDRLKYSILLKERKLRSLMGIMEEWEVWIGLMVC